MKTATAIKLLMILVKAFIITTVCFSALAQEGNEIEPRLMKPEIKEQPLLYWQVKAFRPQANFIAIKAIDKKGKMHEVRAIQNTDDTSILNVKAIVDGEQLPIKLIIKSDDQYYPVKAIDNDGYLIAIKAVTEDGDVYDVKGVSKSGNIIHLRALDKHLNFYNIVAISPEGRVNDVKGIKMMDTEIETVIRGIKVFAHVKSLAQQ